MFFWKKDRINELIQMDKQTKVVNRYWQPNQMVIQNIQRYCETKGHPFVLETGPGIIPFNLATHFIGKFFIIFIYPIWVQVVPLYPHQPLIKNGAVTASVTYTINPSAGVAIAFA